MFFLFSVFRVFQKTAMDSVKELVHFLENTKIRALAKDDRTRISGDMKTHQWYKAFGEYLGEIETCPYKVPFKMSELTESDWVEIIEWLVSQAILADYEDHKHDYNKNKPVRRIKQKVYRLSDCDTKECQAALKKICDVLKVPNDEDNLVTAESLRTLISCKFNILALTNYEASLEEQKDSKIETKDKFDQVRTYQDVITLYNHYEGFNTGDRKVDAAAIILKLLYILEVRGLQNQLNEIVTFIQRFTANPRTNTKLGKVGY